MLEYENQRQKKYIEQLKLQKENVEKNSEV